MYLIILCTDTFRDDQITQKWKNLLDLLDKKKRMLQGYSDLLGMFREIESIQSEMKEMEVYLAFSI